jgi:uncharacterized protein YkwD
VRRSLLVLVAVAAGAVLLLVGSASAAQPRVTLTLTPQGKTSHTRAVFRWKTSHGASRTLCRLRWRPLPGASAQARPKVVRRLSHCGSPATWKHLPSGRYTFTLVVRSRHGRARWRSYWWEIVPQPAVSASPSLSPLPTTTSTTSTATTTTATTTTSTTPVPPPPPPPPPRSATNCAQSPYKYLWPVAPAISTDEQQFVNLVNQARQSLGLLPLSLDPRLSLAADSHSYWQDAEFGNQGLTHVPGCNGSDPFQRVADAGYSASWEGEITLVYPGATAQTAFNMFKGSPPHWALLTSPHFTQIGVGESAYHWTGDLGGP